MEFSVVLKEQTLLVKKTEKALQVAELKIKDLDKKVQHLKGQNEQLNGDFSKLQKQLKSAQSLRVKSSLISEQLEADKLRLQKQVGMSTLFALCHASVSCLLDKCIASRIT